MCFDQNMLSPLVLLASLWLLNAQKYCVNDSTVVYNYENVPSVIGTLINCLNAVQDGLLAPFYETGSRINVSTEIFLNNLISVDEVSSTVSLDLYFNTMWVRANQ
jgi:hypothetical protein